MKQSIVKDNIQAALILSEALATTLGPKGMNKLLVDNIGDTYVTNNGTTITDNIEISHPIAKLVAEVTKTMDEEVGDGSTSTVILTGELLRQASELIDKGVHQTVIINGYRQALKDSLNYLDQIASKEERFKDLISTSLKNKELITELLKALKDTNTDDIIIIKKIGKRLEDTKTINGLLIDKEPVHERMPKSVGKARVLITKTPLEFKNTETEAEIMIDKPAQLQQFLSEERRKLKNMINSIKESGVKVVLCQKGIDDKAQELLAREGIIGIRRIREKDINFLLRATGARLVSDLLNIKQNDLGEGSVKVERFGDEKRTLISNYPGKVKTILVRGSTNQILDEVEKNLEKTLILTNVIRKEPEWVPGAGYTEIRLHKDLMNNKLESKEQMSYESYAKALIEVTKKLISNTGQKPLELLPEMISQELGVNSEGRLINSSKQGVIEPLKLKKQQLISATETAIMILRIDEILKGK